MSTVRNSFTCFARTHSEELVALAAEEERWRSAGAYFESLNFWKFCLKKVVLTHTHTKKREKSFWHLLFDHFSLRHPHNFQILLKRGRIWKFSLLRSARSRQRPVTRPRRSWRPWLRAETSRPTMRRPSTPRTMRSLVTKLSSIFLHVFFYNV